MAEPTFVGFIDDIQKRQLNHMLPRANRTNLGDLLQYIGLNAGTPTNGTSGTGAGRAPTGALCIDTTNAKHYINTNTKASPIWTVSGTQTT